jgi:copper chaperone CopZ
MMIKKIIKNESMMCGMCESHVNDAIRNTFKVKKVNSSHDKGETEVISEDPLTTLSSLKPLKMTATRFLV